MGYGCRISGFTDFLLVPLLCLRSKRGAVALDGALRDVVPLEDIRGHLIGWHFLISEVPL